MVVIERNACDSETLMNNNEDKSHEAFTNSNMRMSMCLHIVKLFIESWRISQCLTDSFPHVPVTFGLSNKQQLLKISQKPPTTSFNSPLG